MLKTAIIGTGGMGRKYAEMINAGEIDGMSLTAAVCRSDGAAEWGRGLGGVTIYRSADELFENVDSFDTLIIATPHKTHPELALRAFEHGKHVMCDKPAGVLAADAERMYKAAEEKGLTYGLMFHQRMRPEYRYLKNMAENNGFGKINRVLMVNTRYFRTKAYHKSSPWRSSIGGEGGGALINQGQHILDMWQWLFGIPDEIEAMVMTGKYNDFDVEDEAHILMHYSSGTTGCFIISTAEGMYEERLVISGTEKCAELCGNRLKITSFGNTDRYRETADCNAREKLNISEEELTFESGPDRELYIKMLKNFADSVLNGTPPAADGREGVGALLITNGAYLSEQRGARIKTAEVMDSFKGL